ncbi:hypothetical protein L1049_027646 [Liquidambar formosana]|uniref:Uncharacterized protein n=1 Tax=Liquidambar formosana TaxID=63359 RepID=A0AAP0RJ16_LIQFO
MARFPFLYETQGNEDPNPTVHRFDPTTNRALFCRSLIHQRKMSRCAYEQNAIATSEEMRMEAVGGYGAEKSSTHVASSPPFFCGSPPSRASNPVIQDAQFGK